MTSKSYEKCDVLVIGAGIAGIMAAMEAATQGCSVILASNGPTFSGSSFYPGTWGLGLIGPENTEDIDDLVDTICTVGCGMAEPDLVREFVSSIPPAIEKVREMGVKLRRPVNGEVREFIPCFDHKHRDWNGILFDSAREVFSAEMVRLGITLLPNCCLVDLDTDKGRVCGATMLYRDRLCHLTCGALVLASGGFGGLFKYHLNTEDVSGAGQFLALRSGAQLVNMEFMQMMSGYISPCYQTIFSEKTFRFTQWPSTIPQQPELLELRSTHGPYTTRLASRVIDEAIFKEFMLDNRGVPMHYCDALRLEQPEFIRNYFTWLWEKKHLTPADTIHIGTFAHASNGGIKIAADASTGVDGLFACGEVTGGMHGADRIGGLSTANGLVFGQKAGASAAAYAGTHSPDSLRHMEQPLWQTDKAAETLEALREIMFQNAMIYRSEQGLTHAMENLQQLRDSLTPQPAKTDSAAAAALLLTAQLGTAEAVLSAALLRRESRGAHNRVDYPSANPAYEKRILISYDDKIVTAFEPD